MAKKYKSIFFDADDTLFDYPRAERTALQACRRKFRINSEAEIFLNTYQRHNRDIWRAFERGEMDQATLRVERFRRLFAEFGFSYPAPEAVSSFYLEALSAQSQLLPGALAAVRRLAKKFPLALITNGIAAVQNRRFAASPIISYFQSIVISEEIGIAKPDPRIFAPALKKIGVNPGEILYVGDSVTSDMAAARNAGMDFCWLNPGRVPVPPGYTPTHIISSIKELPDCSGL